MTLGIVCGFRAEEKLARRLSPLTACAWHNPGAPAALLAAGATSLMSFGLAGGLAPHLAVGQLLLPHTIITAGASYTVDAAAHALLLALFPQAETGPLYAATTVIDSPAAKQALHASSGAVAVDMESGLVAAAAAASGQPFIVLRTVSDDFAHALPPAALVALAPNGRLDLRALLGSLLRHPGQLPALLRTGQGSRQGMRALAACLTTLEKSA